MPSTSKRPTEVNHKFKATDMPEIRLIRSQRIKAYKLEAKVSRMEIITKAIISDIDWKKLGIDVDLDLDQEEFESVNSLITNFRKELGDKISSVLNETSIFLLDQGASTPELSAAAFAMATKYYNREKKPTARPRTIKQSSSNKNPRRPKPSPKASAQHTDLPPLPNSRPTTPTTPPTSPGPSTSTIHCQRLSKPSSKLHKSTPIPTISPPSTWTSQSQRLPKASNLHKFTPTPEMSQPTITSKFPTIKRRSTTKAAPPLPNSRFSHQIPFNFGWN